MINDKISAVNLVKIKMVESSSMSSNALLPSIGNSHHYVASIICPICSITKSVSYTFEKDSVDPIWNMLSFDEHVKIHQDCPNFQVEEYCEYLIRDRYRHMSMKTRKM